MLQQIQTTQAVPTGLEKVSLFPSQIYPLFTAVDFLQLLRYRMVIFYFIYFYKDFPKDYLFIPFPVCMFLILYTYML